LRKPNRPWDIGLRGSMSESRCGRTTRRKR
jgi:hypothetical protein